MIKGVGTDIIEIERISKAINNEKFLLKYFTKNELILFANRNHNAQTVAGNFAVKEAVSKVLGTGIRGFSLQDIEVLRTELGMPYVKLYKEALRIKKGLGIDKIHVSISHSKKYVIAYAVGEGRDSY